MFRQSRVAALIIGVLVLSPFVSASAADGWTNGIHGPESGNVLQGVSSCDSIVICTVALTLENVPVVVALLRPIDELPMVGGYLSALHPRAPPSW
jgi:hypothetical protein